MSSEADKKIDLSLDEIIKLNKKEKSKLNRSKKSSKTSVSKRKSAASRIKQRIRQNLQKKRIRAALLKAKKRPSIRKNVRNSQLKNLQSLKRRRQTAAIRQARIALNRAKRTLAQTIAAKRKTQAQLTLKQNKVNLHQRNNQTRVQRSNFNRIQVQRQRRNPISTSQLRSRVRQRNPLQRSLQGQQKFVQRQFNFRRGRNVQQFRPSRYSNRSPRFRNSWRAAERFPNFRGGNRGFWSANTVLQQSQMPQRMMTVNLTNVRQRGTSRRSRAAAIRRSQDAKLTQEARAFVQALKQQKQSSGAPGASRQVYF